MTMPKSATVALATMIEVLSRPEGATPAQMEEASGLHYETVKCWIRGLHKRPKPVIYVMKWKIEGNKRIPVYSLGFCIPDAERPPRKDPKQIRRDYMLRKRIKAGVLPVEHELAKTERRREIALARPRDANNQSFVKVNSCPSPN